jgi:signal transduction histidine kinase
MEIGALDFPLLIILIVANLSLVLIVFRYAPKNQSRIFFALFGVSQAIWVMVNFFSIRSGAEEILNMARWTIAAAVPHPLLFFLFISSFQRDKPLVKPKYTVLIIVLLALLVTLAISPFLFTHLEIQNEQPTPIPGIGMAVFGFYAFIFITLSFIHLFKKWRKAQNEARAQWRTIGIGLIATFILVLIFNFLVVVLFNELNFIRFGHIYTLPFVVFTAYAMVRHHLLNIKALVTELAVILLGLIILIQLLSAETLNQFIVGGVVLVGVIVVGILLVKSVIREVQQREQLEKLSSELYEANKKLKELDQLKTEFLSIASHQLRTPLSGIKGYLSMMIDGDFGKFSGEQGGILGRVKAEVDRLVRLVQDFLNVSRIESGRLEIAMLEFDIAAVVNTVVKELSPAAMSKGLSLSSDVTDKKVVVTGDPDKIKDVIVNLTDNAIKYTEAGKVWLELSSSDKDVTIGVHDSGVGINHQEIKQLFNKFKRAKGIARVSASGTGLGLFIAKKIITGHGGDIWAKSKGENKGSVFAFTIPIKGKPVARQIKHD